MFRRVSSGSTIYVDQNKPAFDFEKIQPNLTFYDDPDGKTAGLRKVTKPVFEELK